MPTLAFGRVATQIQVKDNAFSPQAPALRTFQHGASFWLAGLPLRALHNPGQVPAVLVAICRSKSAGDR